ncbi:MAG: glycosyltransferase family 2 protein [Pleurocapsa minor GSE-CHR-MK-17-07R]|jgi:glycosyltransferase involved in cell wall biosynthesis|nr:glycosyltransferase family 2 protein [Pleurocapsa minor GSE-CHR-MK 17-07R]
MTALTVCILTYNEAEHVRACIESAAFADRVMVFDSFSTDATVEIARASGATVVQRPFDNYAGQRNAALDAIGAGEWVLFVDADERVTPALAGEVRSVIATGSATAYRIPRHNYIFGRLTLGAGWYPDFQTRLLRQGRVQYDPKVLVHEVVLVDGETGTLSQPLVHYNYRDAAQFAAKQARYTAYDARILFEQGMRPKVYTPFTQPVRHFIWRFVTLKGYRDGLHGLRLSLLMAWYEGVKYRRLAGLIRENNQPTGAGN